MSFQPRGDGSTDLHAQLPAQVASRLRTSLEAFTSPRRTPLGDPDALPVARRRGEAFCGLLENVPDTGLPVHGGSATSVLVTFDLDTLTSGSAWPTPSTGDRLTAEGLGRGRADGRRHRAHDPGSQPHHHANGCTTFHRTDVGRPWPCPSISGGLWA